MSKLGSYVKTEYDIFGEIKEDLEISSDSSGPDDQEQVPDQVHSAYDMGSNTQNNQASY